MFYKKNGARRERQENSVFSCTSFVNLKISLKNLRYTTLRLRPISSLLISFQALKVTKRKSICLAHFSLTLILALQNQISELFQCSIQLKEMRMLGSCVILISYRSEIFVFFSREKVKIIKSFKQKKTIYTDFAGLSFIFSGTSSVCSFERK